MGSTAIRKRSFYIETLLKPNEDVIQAVPITTIKKDVEGKSEWLQEWLKSTMDMFAVKLPTYQQKMVMDRIAKEKKEPTSTVKEVSLSQDVKGISEDSLTGMKKIEVLRPLSKPMT